MMKMVIFGCAEASFAIKMSPIATITTLASEAASMASLTKLLIFFMQGIMICNVCQCKNKC